MLESKQPLIIIAGPTAVGKTKTSVELAKKINGEIISADSMQVYRSMDIGSAKITPQEMEDIPHHLIDVLDPTESFDVTVFCDLAKQAIDTIVSRGKIPILVGGTGFYIQAILYDIDFSEAGQDTSFRKELEQEAAVSGPEVLHERLKKLDPEAAAAIHPNNVKRVIRALEFISTGGTKISEHNKQQSEKESPYDFRYFALTDDREMIYERIDERVDEMMSNGLLDEVVHLSEQGCKRGMTSMQGLGYKEILDYLDGDISLEEAVYRIKRDSRHYAKRQLTWLRREKSVIWIDRRDYPDTNQIVEKMVRELQFPINGQKED